MMRRPRPWALCPVIFPGHDCISRSGHTLAACGERSAILFSLGGESDFATPGRERFLAPSLQSRPKLGKRPEFCATANEHRDLTFHRVGIVVGLAHVFDVFEF